MLNLERLRTLHMVARHGSISAAAEVLHITTSAVSQQLAKLEREVGQRLLERNGRGVRLTEAAQLLVAHAERILSDVERAEADLEAHRDAVVGHLSLAAFATAARGLAPGALARLRGRYPELRVELGEREPVESIQAVAHADIDLAIVQDWANAPLALHEGLIKSPLLEDVLDVALPQGHALAGRPWVDLEELAAEPWVAWRRGSICYDWLLHTLRSRNCEPYIAHTAAECPTQLALVAAGLGAAIVPRLGRGPVPPGVVMVGVQPRVTRHVYAVWRADAARRPAIRAVLEALAATAGGLSAGGAEPAGAGAVPPVVVG
ncbi:LysR family transcriptional regulator [Allonocardiopsis opalescens]|uniref:Molybdate transport repressor ModE-like protein n=1 Tax=Allonocardiopsis opalescens TaxID=1144618 RepID=A0A2T0PUA0_9ACTN|nr:LysR family transcriptional regulator [Allonocardiopsis opalescens]PRX92306.1 molybdate transport repressor ModE-like protein [Allonocardiopsis opalescens]